MNIFVVFTVLFCNLASRSLGTTLPSSTGGCVKGKIHKNACNTSSSYTTFYEICNDIYSVTCIITSIIINSARHISKAHYTLLCNTIFWTTLQDNYTVSHYDETHTHTYTHLHKHTLTETTQHIHNTRPSHLFPCLLFLTSPPPPPTSFCVCVYVFP